jgi:nucleoside-diphosphate-sugar epimerase
MANAGNPDLRGIRALVTGAAGFIGRHLLAGLSASGATIATLDRNDSPRAGAAESYLGDLRDAAFVQNALRKSAPDVVFHLAAFKQRSTRIDDFVEALETNVLGSLHLFAAAATLPALKKIVVLGTAEEYGRNTAPFLETIREHPVSAYSYSKQSLTHLCEVLHHLHGLPAVVLRPTVAYGPGQSTDMFLPALIRSLLADTPFPMTAGEQTRDFVYVSDVVDAMLLAATAAGSAGQILNIGGGQPITIAALAHKVAALTGKPGLLQPGKLAYRQGEVMSYSVDIAKARALLGWSPRVGFDEGLAVTIDYFRQQA